MENKHTPGPWGENGQTVLVRGISWLGFANYENSTAYANARLIAAAPDLLEALEMALVWLDYEGKYDVQGIRSVIAKARGQ